MHQNTVAGNAFGLRNIGECVHEALSARRFPVCLQVSRRSGGCGIVAHVGGRIIDDADGNIILCALPQRIRYDCGSIVAQLEIVDCNVETSASFTDETRYSGCNLTDLRRAFRWRIKWVAAHLLEKHY